MPTRYSWRNFHPQPTLHYIKDALEANTHVAALSGPVGFDLEWRPSFRKGEPEHPVALVQLANSSSILLIQISRMSEFPQSLRDFLENPKFPKAGVGIQNDAKKIFRDCEISVRNCVDLSLLARSVDNARWKGKYRSPLGLARLIEAYEDSEMPKGKVARTNWELELTDIQSEYAANDAHAGFLLYNRLSKLASTMTKQPDPSCYSFNSIKGVFHFPSSDSKYWAPHNPDYDPGPPPPPKPPKTQAAGVPVSSSSLSSASKVRTAAKHSSSPNAIFPIPPSVPAVGTDPHADVTTNKLMPFSPPFTAGRSREYATPAQGPRVSLPRSSAYPPPPLMDLSGQALAPDQLSSLTALPSHTNRRPRHHVGVIAQGPYHEGRPKLKHDRPPKAESVTPDESSNTHRPYSRTETSDRQSRGPSDQAMVKKADKGDFPVQIKADPRHTTPSGSSTGDATQKKAKRRRYRPRNSTPPQAQVSTSTA